MEASVDPQHRRAHRIAEEAWEHWREELVGLYLEDEELKEIPKIMAKKHQFLITTAQLKDQFRKWQVKKNFSKQDLAWMASMKRKRGALGKGARFQQHGHDVEEERLERALKRHRSRMDTPESVPMSLKLVLTPTQSPQLAQIAPGTQSRPITTAQHGDHTNTHPTLPSPYDSNLQLASNAPRLDHASFEDSVGIDLMADRDLMGSMFPSEWITLESFPNAFSIYQLPPVLDDTEQILRSPVAEEGNFMLSRAITAQLSDSDWRTFLNLSPNTQARSKISGSVVSSPRQAQPEDPQSQQRFTLFSEARSSSALSVQSSEINMPINSNVEDPEEVLSNLQLMRKTLAKLGSASDTSVLCRCYHRNRYDSSVIRILEGQWLQHQLQDLICDACTSTAAIVHRRRLALEGPPSPAVLDIGITTLHSFSAYFRMNVHGSARIHSPNGLLTIHHGTAARSPSNDDHFSARATIMLSFIPNHATKQTEGLQVVFFHPPQNQWEWHISPSIRTFNVVPKDAEIIARVKMNDVQGIRSLFDARKASARDVDESGYSLLSNIQCPFSSLGTETAREVIEFLFNLGYDAEERDADGRTSLLYMASSCSPVIVRSLKALVRKNVNLNVIDYEDAEIEDWVTSIEDDDSAARTADDDYSSDAANHSLTDGHDTYASEGWDPDDPSVRRYWRFIRRYIPMLKRRMRFKVLTLLQAECDPNHLDNNGESPSEFAQREGIWQE
ncbi:MAG: hypothetical protein Q9181_006548 [Wetmoreana brouardii]